MTAKKNWLKTVSTQFCLTPAKLRFNGFKTMAIAIPPSVIVILWKKNISSFSTWTENVYWGFGVEKLFTNRTGVVWKSESSVSRHKGVFFSRKGCKILKTCACTTQRHLQITLFVCKQKIKSVCDTNLSWLCPAKSPYHYTNTTKKMEAKQLLENANQ